MRFLLLELILADQVADLPSSPLEASSGQEWQYEISTVRVHIVRSPNQEWQYEISTVRASYWQINWQIYITISTVRAHSGRSSGRSTLPH